LASERHFRCLVTGRLVTISFVMSAPQLADSSTSSEWFRAVAESGAEKPAAAPPQSSSTDARRKRFVRLVTYTMGGLVAFTLLGVASFAWRRHAMQSALAAPVPLAAAPAPAAEATPTTAAEAAPIPAAAAATPPKPVAAPKRAVAATKPAKKATRSPFLSSVKPAAKATAR
jgi:hypothetical protein